jgi:hypothetical protein
MSRPGVAFRVGWVGLEPTTNALKGRCSTIELPTRVGRNVVIQFLPTCKKRCTGGTRAGVKNNLQKSLALLNWCYT